MSGKRFQLDIGDDYCFINDELELYEIKQIFLKGDVDE